MIGSCMRYNSSLASFDVNNIELAWINLFLQYIFYIHTYVEDILNLAHAAQRAVMSAEQRDFERRTTKLTR